MQKQIWTINKLLAWAIDYFKTRKIPEPRLSAELLLSAVLDLSRMDLYLKYDLELKDDQLKKYKEFILRRLNHEPIQYITGEAYFRKIRLDVDKSVLIPRPETELLVERAKKAVLYLAELKKSSKQSYKTNTKTTENNAALIKKSLPELKKVQNGNDSVSSKNETMGIERTCLSQNQVINILEIGTGSGAIALSLLFETEYNADKTFPIDIIATDISSDALRIALKNTNRILNSEKKFHLELFECDVVPQDNEKFFKKYLKNIDIVISNPPYIAGEDYENLDRQIKDFEPETALNAGRTGTEKYSHILKKVKSFLNPEAAYIIFETDPLTSPELQKIIKAEFKGCNVSIEKDYNGQDRIMAAFIAN
ncbi:MAG: N5-glutamine methyltransferase family protein [Candidatus Humimicrobiaceae bacterium]